MTGIKVASPFICHACDDRFIELARKIEVTFTNRYGITLAADVYVPNQETDGR